MRHKTLRRSTWFSPRPRRSFIDVGRTRNNRIRALIILGSQGENCRENIHQPTFRKPLGKNRWHYMEQGTQKGANIQRFRGLRKKHVGLVGKFIPRKGTRILKRWRATLPSISAYLFPRKTLWLSTSITLVISLQYGQSHSDSGQLLM